MTPVSAFVVGALAGVYFIAGCIGFANSEAYQNWKAEQEEKGAAYAFSALSGDALSAEGGGFPELPDDVEIVVVASGN